MVAFHTRSKMLDESLEEKESLERFCRLQAAATPAYPPAQIKFLIACWLYEIAPKVVPSEAPMPYARYVAFGDAADLLAADSGTVSPDVLLQFVENQLRFDEKSIDQLKEMYQACLSNPKIDPWITHTVGAEYYRTLAWDHRGSGYADSVSKEGWQKFHEYLPQAAAHCRRAWLLHPELPEPPSMLVDLAMAGGEDTWTTENWLRVALVADAGYGRTYQRYLWSLMPRWGGSHARMSRFAVECIATDRWDLGIPDMSLIAVRNFLGDAELNARPGDNPAAGIIAAAYVQSFAAARKRGEVNPERFASQLALLTATLINSGDFKSARIAFENAPPSFSSWWILEGGVAPHYGEAVTFAATGTAPDKAIRLHQYLTRPATRHPDPEQIADLLQVVAEARLEEQDAAALKFYDLAARMLDQLDRYARENGLN